MTPAAIHSRYDELAAVLEWWRTVPTDLPLDDGVGVATRVLVSEARLLDDDRLDEWLAGWDADGVLWVPLDDRTHPEADQSFYLDDMRRLRERVEWRRHATAWSQRPPVRTVRSVSSIESHRRQDGTLDVRSSVTILEHRGERRHTWTGHQFHVLAPPSPGQAVPMCRIKVLCIPELTATVPHPGVVM